MTTYGTFLGTIPSREQHVAQAMIALLHQHADAPPVAPIEVTTDRSPSFREEGPATSGATQLPSEPFETPFGIITTREASFAFAVVDILLDEYRAREGDLLEAVSSTWTYV
jgi:hypothetical protein